MLTLSRRISTLIEMLSVALKGLFLATGKNAPLVSQVLSPSVFREMLSYGPGREPSSTVGKVT